MNIPSVDASELPATSSHETDGTSGLPTDHGALVHCPPKEAEEDVDRASCNTGMFGCLRVIDGKPNKYVKYFLQDCPSPI